MSHYLMDMFLSSMQVDYFKIRFIVRDKSLIVLYKSEIKCHVTFSGVLPDHVIILIAMMDIHYRSLPCFLLAM